MHSEQLLRKLTDKLRGSCLTTLDCRDLHQNFEKHAESKDGQWVWSESTLSSFLEIPEHSDVEVSPSLFRLAQNIAAFPFRSLAPQILTEDALVRAVVVLTERYKNILSGGRGAWEKEIWRALAVIDVDPDLATMPSGEERDQSQKSTLKATGEPGEESESNSSDLVLSALQCLGAMNSFKGESDAHAMIASHNFSQIVKFFLLIGPLTEGESLSTYRSALDDTKFRQHLLSTATCILASFGDEANAGIKYETFRAVVGRTLPRLFNPIKPLFEHLLLPGKTGPHKPHQFVHSGIILTPPLLSQIHFLLPPSIHIPWNPTLLHSTDMDGYNMHYFREKVFKYPFPTIFLLIGEPTNPKTITKKIPDLPRGALPNERVIYGAYVQAQWEDTDRHCLRDPSCILFQLSPQHDVFPAIPNAPNHLYVSHSAAVHTGFGFGSPVPDANGNDVLNSRMREQLLPPNHSPARHSYNGSPYELPLGPVSLHIEPSLQCGVFVHNAEHRCAYPPSFQASQLPESCRYRRSNVSGGGKQAVPTQPLRSWRDVIAIRRIEVWGCGQ